MRKMKTCGSFLISCLMLSLLAASVFVSCTNGQSDFDLRIPLSDSRSSQELSHEKASEEFSQSHQPWSLNEARQWKHFAAADEDSVELIIGLNAKSKDSLNVLKDLSKVQKAHILNTIGKKDRLVAAVIKVQIDDLTALTDSLESKGVVRYLEPNFRFTSDFVPNDPFWTMQWGPQKIEADQAWDATIANDGVLVAIIDTGIDYTHPDLIANYVPFGYDWVNADNDPLDDNGHGTHCAGIVAASINNSIGIAGVGNVRIMAEKGLDSRGSGYEDDLANAIIHAVDQGADILSNSWGGPESALVRDAIQYAVDNDVLVVAAAGNEASTLRHYPAAYDEVIAVAATDQNDIRAYFSNMGSWIDVAAPGVGIYSTMPTYNVTMSVRDYGNLSGTSMACPHAAGVLALAKANHVEKSSIWIKELLKRTVDDLGTSGFDPDYGYGRINARRIVEPSPQHDIMIINATISQNLGPAGGIANVSAYLLNFGLQDESDVSVQMLVNSVLEQAIVIPAFPGGSITRVEFGTSITQEENNVTLYSVPIAGETITANNRAEGNVVAVATIEVPQHYSSIQEALDAARIGDSIHVADGTYSESISVSKNDIDLIGQSTAETIINGPSQETIVNIHSSNVTLAGFALRGYTISGQGSSIYGIEAVDVSNVNVTSIDITSCGIGIGLMNCNNSIVEGNTITGTSNTYNGFYGVYSSGLSFSTIRSNVIWDYRLPRSRLSQRVWKYGLKMMESDHNSILDNQFIHNLFGAWISGSCNVIDNNDVSDNQVGGIQVTGTLNAVRSNVIENNGHESTDYPDSDMPFGLTLSGESNLLRNNTMNANNNNFGMGWAPYSLSYFVEDIDATNTINQKPLYYWVNQHNSSIPSDAGYVALVNCSDITVHDLFLEDNVQALLLAYTTNSTITDNEMTSGEHGIVMMYSSNNFVSSNTISENTVGTILYDSSNNTLIRNNFEGRSQVHLNIYRNSQNTWDANYPEGGNYWGSSGVDIYHGPYQNETGSDGIIDSRRVIDQNNTDRYPLMKPHGATIGITSVTSYKTAIGKGYTTVINVTLVNYSPYEETGFVTIRLNSTVICSQNITILLRSSKVISYTLNTSTYDFGNYTLGSNVEPGRDSYTLDNSYTYGAKLKVTIPGDVNGDWCVNSSDTALISANWCKIIGDPGFNPNCDINTDWIVNIVDAAICASHLGQHYP